MTRGEILRLFLHQGGRVVDGRQQLLQIKEQDLMDFLAEFNERQQLELLDMVFERRRREREVIERLSVDVHNSDLLDRRRGIDESTAL